MRNPCGLFADMPRRRVPAWVALAATGMIVTALQGAEIANTLYSAHVWRGQVRNEHRVLRTALAVAPHPLFLLGGSAVLDITGRDPATDALVSTVELSVFYLAPAFGPLHAHLGLIERRYPGSLTAEPAHGLQPAARNRATQGVLSLNLSSFLAPCVDLFFDLRDTESFYTTLGMGHLFVFAHDLPTLEAAASLGFANAAYNAAYFAVDHPALNDGVLSLLLRQQVARSCSLTLELTYSRMLDNRLRDVLDTADRFFGGMGVEVRF